MSASQETTEAASALAIMGMTCSGRLDSVTRALARVPGVVHVAVDLASGQAHVTGDASPQAQRTTVETAGYGVARNRQTVGRESHHARGSCR